MALLARFSCGCSQRVEIPAPPIVTCVRHGRTARLITTSGGQVRYVASGGAGESDSSGRTDKRLAEGH